MSIATSNLSKPTSTDDLCALREQWTTLYSHALPSLAAAKSPAQPRWPVHLDHCFARIILDNAIGVDRPWHEVLRKPAVKNMSVEQLRKAIELGEKVREGKVELVGLDERSLGLRGKVKRRAKRKLGGSEGEDGIVVGEERVVDASKVRPQEVITGPSCKTRKGVKQETVSKYFMPSPASPKQTPSQNLASSNAAAPADLQSSSSPSKPQHDATIPSPSPPNPTNQDLQHLITNSRDLTPFRRATLTSLLLIPRGRWTTYAHLATHLSTTTGKPTCARAIGSAVRNNPFAPAVPCHRVLAAGGKLGGFGGDWGEEGRHAGEKRRLLGAEGVRFDSGGKARGLPYEFEDV